MLRNRSIWLFFGILALIIISSLFMIRLTSPPPPLKPRLNVTEGSSGKYYTIRDQKGRIILQTGFPVNVGDIFINEQDLAFKVCSLRNWEGVAAPTRMPAAESAWHVPAALFNVPGKAVPPQASRIHVVMYHTHSDESYPKTDGTSSIPGNGTIFEVGSSMADSLRNSGISVTHSDNSHGPHDANAYYRSRRTLFKLLKERPDAAFDVHRDSAPSEAYLTLINGLPTARSMIVLGRQNPHMSTNLAFAKRIKAQADDIYPGLLRGIFIGRGNYNQDLYPSALLFEIGTDQAPRENAERGARNLADVVAQVLKKR
ncbi:MAG: stage II sporulation protein P [Syntrophomonadaceae bacterium]|nr:stage II sporulation protein P [Syntrophomonadaceae bacterium]